MKRASEAVKAEFLDYAPKFKNAGPDRIVAASGILTMKNKEFKETLEDVDDKVLKGFHNEATRRGHASILTSVNYYFWLEGSRIIDFYFSSFPFGSYVVFSSRRIEIGPENLVVPDAIANSEFAGEYERICTRLVELYHRVKDETGRTDYARRILPIGFISKLFFNLPLQVVLGIIKEVREDEKRKNPVLPKELWELGRVLEKEIRNNTGYLAGASLRLAYDTNFPHPNLFKSDTEFQAQTQTKILVKDESLGKLLSEVKNKLGTGGLQSKEQISETAAMWKDFVDKVQDKILLEHRTAISLSAWNDVKRHRTVRQKVESIYHAVERSLNGWKDDYFYMPPVEDTGLQSEIVNAYKEALAFYKKMVDGGVEKRDAIYVIPHAINLGIVMLLDGYHIFDPFGFVGIRTCSTTDHEVTAIANAIANKVAKEAAREVPGVENLIGPKCKLGYCPEREFCGLVKKFVKDYDEKMHAIFQ